MEEAQKECIFVIMAIKSLSKWQCSMISSLPKGMASMQSLCMKCSAAHISVKETPSLKGKEQPCSFVASLPIFPLWYFTIFVEMTPITLFAFMMP